MGKIHRNPMSHDTGMHITDAFKMKKRLNNGLNLKLLEKTPTSLREGRSDQQVSVPSTSLDLKRVKTSPSYIRNKKQRLSQKKSAHGATTSKTPNRPTNTSELRRSPRGFLQCTPNGPKRCLVSQESPQEISWEGQSPRYRQQLKSGLRDGIPDHAKDVTEIINVLKSHKVPQEETEENPLMQMWLLPKLSAQRCSLAPAQLSSSRQTVPKKPLRKSTRVCAELVHLMKTAKDACTTSSSSVKGSALPETREEPSTTVSDDNLWDDDNIFNDDSFMQQTQITEAAYFSQQANVDKVSKQSSTLCNIVLTAEPKKLTISEKEVSSGSSLKSRYTFLSSLPKNKSKDIASRPTPEDSVTLGHLVKHKSTFRTSTPTTSQQILCPETPNSPELQTSSPELLGSVAKLIPVNPIPANNLVKVSSVCSSRNNQKRLSTNSSNSFCLKENMVVKSEIPEPIQSSSVISCLGKVSVGTASKSATTAKSEMCYTTHVKHKPEPEKLHKSNALLDEDMSGMLDDDFIVGPDLLEFVEAAESTYQAASQPTSQSSSQPSSQVQCTQEEISKKREAALQRRRERARAQLGKNV